MRKILFLFFLVFLIPVVSWAEPWLVCDPQAGVAKYQVIVKDVGGAVITDTEVVAQADGSLKYDLFGFGSGKWTFEVRGFDTSGWPSDWASREFQKPGQSGNWRIIK